MTQSLWYLKQDDRVHGPYPVPRVAELLEAGSVDPDWEISLNGKDWLTIRESGQFEESARKWALRNEGDPDWREERHKARQRWLGSEGVEAMPIRDTSQDERTRQAIAQDHRRTEALLEEERSKRTSLVPLLLGILLLLVVGIGVWWGQREKPIQAGIALAADCAAPASDGINWSGCDKRGLAQAGLKARNARMAKARLDNAQLAGADLAYAVLTGASLRGAELKGASLMGADLTGADLTGADLSDASLEYAVLKDGRLPGVRLDRARLDKATWVDGRVCAEGSLGECR